MRVCVDNPDHEGIGEVSEQILAHINTITIPPPPPPPLPPPLPQVLIKGRHVFMGYMWEGQATRDTFTEDGWLKTGDLGYISEVCVCVCVCVSCDCV